MTLGDDPLGGASNAVMFDRVKKLAERIIEFRTETATMKSFVDFANFLDTIATEGDFSAWLVPLQRELLLANANPNWTSNQFIPERHRWSAVSRIDVLASRAEFTFTPGGFFEVESLGWVEDAAGERIAEHRIEAQVQVWTLIHRTSQRDFIEDLQSASNTITGPEPMSNVLGSTTNYADTDDPRLDDLYGTNRISRNGSPYEGWIQALTEDVSTTKPGGVLTFSQVPNVDPNVSFYHPFLTSFTPAKESLAPAGGQAGEGAASDLWKKTGETIFRGETLTPDGAAFFNYIDEEISFDASPGILASAVQNFRPDFGTISFWLKLPAAYEPGADPARDPLWGSHEALAYVTQNLGPMQLEEQNPSGTAQTATSEVGVTWKLERYGYKIRSTRFFWILTMPAWVPEIPPLPTISPDPAINLSYLWTEVEFELDDLNWNDNEWHRFTHSWTDYTEQAVFVDSQLVGYVLDSEFPAVGPGSNAVVLTLDQNDPDYDTRFSLVSCPSNSRAMFGGLLFTQSSAQAVYHGADEQAGTTCRISNAKIDELTCHQMSVLSEADLAAAFQTFRFEPNPTDPTHAGRLQFDEAGTVGFVTFTESLPLGGETISKLVEIGSTPLPATQASFVLAGPSGVSVTAASTMDYTLTFLLGSGSNATPVFDDLTVYVAHRPVFVGYKSILER